MRLPASNRHFPVLTALISSLGMLVGSCSSGTNGTTTHAASALTIALASGGDQQVAAGAIIPTAPVILVTDSDGNAHANIGVTLVPVGGMGSIAATSIVTGADGRAALPTWHAPFTPGDFYIDASVTSAGVRATVRIHASVTYASPVIMQPTIGPTGGVFTATVPGSPLNGLVVTVPPGAFRIPVTLLIETSPAPQLPANVSAASPLIQIHGGGLPDSMIRIRIPATAPAGMALVAVAIGPGNVILPLSTVSSDQSSVTIETDQVDAGFGIRAQGGMSTRQFPTLDFLIIYYARPTSGTYVSGFVPGRDDASYVNSGSKWAFGYCSGETVLAGWQFLQHVNQRSTLQFRDRFSAFLSSQDVGSWPFLGQLNPAVRLASALQTMYGTWSTKVRFNQSGSTIWQNVIDQLFFNQRPVYLEMWTSSFPPEGHSVLVVKVDISNNYLYIANPNNPGGLAQQLRYDPASGTIQQFTDQFSGNLTFTRFKEATTVYTEQSDFVGSVVDNYLNSVLPGFTPITVRLRLPSGQITDAASDNVTLNASPGDATLSVGGATLSGSLVQWVNRQVTNGSVVGDSIGFSFVTPGSELTVPIAFGRNEIGLLFKSPMLDGSHPGNSYWSDAKLVIVNRSPQGALPIVTTTSATGITQTSFLVNGLVNPNGVSTTVFFEWGSNSALTAFTATGSTSAGSGTTTASWFSTFTSFACGTTTYYRMAAATANGDTVRGAIFPATTLACGAGFLGVSEINNGPPSNLYFVPVASNGIDQYISQVVTPSGNSLAINDIATMPNGSLAGVTNSTLYLIDQNSGVATVSWAFGRTDVVGLVADVSGTLYASTNITGAGQLLRGSLGGAWTVVGSFGSSLTGSGDLAFSQTGTLYGTFVRPDGVNVLGTVNPTSGAAQVLSPPSGAGFSNIFGLSFAGGSLYGLTTNSNGTGGNLIRFDLNTGTATAVRAISFGAAGAGIRAPRTTTVPRVHGDRLER